jgi:hypothetical protein
MLSVVIAVAVGQQTWSSSEAFEAMRGAVRAAQQFIKASDGSLTTLVAAVVAPQKWGPGHSLLTVLIGDSPAYVWRAQPARVDEISYTPPLHGLPRYEVHCRGHLLAVELQQMMTRLLHLMRLAERLAACIARAVRATISGVWFMRKPSKMT